MFTLRIICGFAAGFAAVAIYLDGGLQRGNPYHVAGFTIAVVVIALSWIAAARGPRR